MMQAPLLQDLAIVWAIAWAMGYLFHRLGQPALVGYVLAGLVIGPHTPPFALVSDAHSIRTIADLGLVFLMFSLGLEFSLPKLRRAGPSALVSATVVVSGMILTGYGAGRLFGWSGWDSLLLGAVLSISGSSIIAKVFMDLRLSRERFAESVFGFMICDDIAAMIMLSMVSAIGAAAVVDPSLPAMTLARVLFFVLLFLLAGLAIVPRLLAGAARLSAEMAGLLAVALCVSSAVIASLLGFSIALGAFLMGAIIAATPQIFQVSEWVRPLREMFSALFFVAAGMLVDPAVLWAHAPVLLALIVLTVLGRAALGTAASLLAGHETVPAVRIGISIAQIGEFSFVIAALGAAVGLASPALYPIAVSVSFATMLATPYLIARSEPAARRFERATPALQDALARYRARLGLRAAQARSPESAILARYLVRLAIYLAVLVALAALLRALTGALEADDRALRLLLWAGGAGAGYPALLLASKYINHLLLLAATAWMAEARLAGLFQRLNIRKAYAVSDMVTVALLAGAFAGASLHLSPGPAAAAGAAATLLALLLRRRLTVAMERAEEILDEVLGLATSEPTRQAIMSLGDRQLLFYDLTEQVFLPPGALAEHRRISDLRLRHQTGATIAAVYRHGVHITNPAPDFELRANDIVVLLGEEEQRLRARQALVGSEDL